MIYPAKILVGTLVVLITVCSCNNERPNSEQEAEKGEIILAISKMNTDKVYAGWINEKAPEIVCINMYGLSEDSVELIIKKCDGLLLTGGEDIYPALHGKADETARCGRFDSYRDSLEIVLLKTAMRRKIPVLGICRGHQMLNVATGGSLLIDIPTDLDSNTVHRSSMTDDAYHVVLNENDFFRQITGADSGFVNSNHHQGVDGLSPLFSIAVRTSDGLPEAIIIKDTAKYNVIIGVQWHPERLKNSKNYSGNIRKYFIRRIRMFYNGK